MIWRNFQAIAVAFSLGLVASVPAQEFRPRGQAGSPTSQGQVATPASSVPNAWNRSNGRSVSDERPKASSEGPQQTASAVSPDLLQIYAQTKNVRSEAEATNIARLCAKLVSDSNRSSIDQEYAASLLAWALNRRGEMRSEQAELLVQAGKMDSAKRLDGQAADDFATAVQYAPENWRHLHNYAISLAMRGEYPQAIQQLDMAIERNPNYANARFNRAELYLETGEYESAEQDYTAAIELSQDAQYFNSRAHCRFLMQSYPGALEDYQRAVELDSGNATYATDLGDACQFLGRWEEAAKAYKQAVAANAEYGRAYQNAAWLMSTCPDERLRNTDLALSAAKKALQLAGQRNAEVVETLAAATAATGKFQAAVELQREAVQLASRQAGPQSSQLAEFQQRLELYQKGKAYLQPQPATALIPASLTKTASSTGK